MEDYCKRVAMRIINFAILHNIELSNAHGIGFNKKQICELVGEATLLDPLEFETPRKLNMSSSMWRTDIVKFEDLPDGYAPYITILDAIMHLFGNNAIETEQTKKSVWEMLKVLPRTSIIAQALTGDIWDSTLNEDEERFRLKLNIAFGYYEDGLVKDDQFSNDLQRGHHEKRMRGYFRKTDDPIVKLILSELPNMELYNGTAIRELFSNQTKLHCCEANTGTSSKFMKVTKSVLAKKRKRSEDEGSDKLFHPDYLTFVHYGTLDSDIDENDIYTDEDENATVLVTNQLYVSTSPRWKWNNWSTIFVLKVKKSINCDIVRPPSYAELVILPGDEGKLQTAVLPSLRISSTTWKITKIMREEIRGRQQTIVFCES
jgi:hypothetical protein